MMSVRLEQITSAYSSIASRAGQTIPPPRPAHADKPKTHKPRKRASAQASDAGQFGMPPAQPEPESPGEM